MLTRTFKKNDKIIRHIKEQATSIFQDTFDNNKINEFFAQNYDFGIVNYNNNNKNIHINAFAIVKSTFVGSRHVMKMNSYKYELFLFYSNSDFGKIIVEEFEMICQKLTRIENSTFIYCVESLPESVDFYKKLGYQIIRTNVDSRCRVISYYMEKNVPSK
jgi:hypothetical protein